MFVNKLVVCKIGVRTIILLENIVSEITIENIDENL